MRLVLSLALVVILGVAAFWFQTDGFSVVTTEAARRADIIKQPRQIPDAVLQASNNHNVGLLDDLASDGRVAVINFMYTRCPSICTTMGAEFQRLQDQILEQGWGDQIRLISISFDPADTARWLGRYQEQMGVNPGVWQAMLASDQVQRNALLQAFGIIVVPAPMGQFEHNGAYHIVTPDGLLRRIVDLEDSVMLLSHLQSYARRDKQVKVVQP
ncbi:SCO family protein [Alcaligenaceae bacterium]|nr:SCO family protein [Alcaligenaceae bacterium]